MPENPQSSASLWLLYSLATVLAWGLYGVLLHLGQLGMQDPGQGRIKAFLCVGVAYFLFAVLAPAFVLWRSGVAWSFPVKGACYSTVAGVAGAVGAFCVLLAFGARGQPAVVMSIVFAGAPLVNAVVAMLVHPPSGGLSSVRWPFVAGIVLAACGGYLVMRFRPPPAPSAAPAGAPHQSAR